MFPEFWVICIPPNQVEFFFMKTRDLYAFCYTTLCYWFYTVILLKENWNKHFLGKY